MLYRSKRMLCGRRSRHRGGRRFLLTGRCTRRPILLCLPGKSSTHLPAIAPPLFLFALLFFLSKSPSFLSASDEVQGEGCPDFSRGDSASWGVGVGNDGLVPDAADKAVPVSDDVVAVISDVIVGTATATVVTTVNVHSVTIAVVIAVAVAVVIRRYVVIAESGSDSMANTLRDRPSSQSSPISPCCFGIRSGPISCRLPGGTITYGRWCTSSSSISGSFRGPGSSSI